MHLCAVSAGQYLATCQLLDCVAKCEASARGLTRRGKGLRSLAKAAAAGPSACSFCDMSLIFSVKTHAKPMKAKLKIVVVVSSSSARVLCQFERCEALLAPNKPSASMFLWLIPSNAGGAAERFEEMSIMQTPSGKAK